MKHPAHLLLFAAVAFAAAGCDITGSDPPRTPATLDVVSGDLQTATAGTQLPQPLVVEVLDAGGNPVRGQVVNWVVTAGGGSVFAGTAVTDANGRAQERWTLGTVAGDTQRVEARAVGSSGEAIVFGEFRAVASAGAAASVAPLDSASRTGAPGQPVDSLAVRVTDAHGNPVPGATVSFAATGGGSVSPASAITGADGVARAEWTLGTNVGVQQSATATVGSGPTATFTASVVLAGTLTAVAGGGQTGPIQTILPDSLEVRFTTAGGVPIEGAVIEWWVGSTETALPRNTPTDADGIARTEWGLGTLAGTRTANAKVRGTTIDVNFTATVLPGPPDTIYVAGIDAPYEIPIGTSVTVRVQVKDAFGNVVPGETVAWASVCGGPISPTSSTTDAAGVARTSWTIESDCGGHTEGRATVAGLEPAVFGVINVVSGVAARVDIGPDRTVAASKDTLYFRPQVFTAAGAYVQPYEDCRYACYQLAWTSSDTTVAILADFYWNKVDTDVGEALFTVRGPGTTTIVARAKDPKYSYADSMVLTVTADGAVSATRLRRSEAAPPRARAAPPAAVRREPARAGRRGR